MSLLLLFGGGAGGAGTGCTAITTTGTGGVPVTVGREYVAVADFLAATVARSTLVGIRWYDAAGVLLSSSQGGVNPDNTTSFYQATCFATAPASAAFAAVYVEVIGASAAEVHYSDRIGLMEPALWSLPE
jgi:hypothetical protein